MKCSVPVSAGCFVLGLPTSCQPWSKCAMAASLLLCCSSPGACQWARASHSQLKFCWNPPSRNACLLPPGCSAEDSLEAVTEAVHPTKLKILTATLYGKRLLTSALEQNKG